MGAALLVTLDIAAPVGANIVGAKAASLLRLRQAGFVVPDGVVLTTAFFAPWAAAVAANADWLEAIETLHRSDAGREQDDVRTICEDLGAWASALPLDGERRTQLDGLVRDLAAGPYAVRSSSPEEDQPGASFAGLYETTLGVHADSLEAAVRKCFASCVGERVLRYKLAQGYRSLQPSLAVIVQRQAASEVSGVAFSINPLTNDYDELLVNASWGLGEALVGGDLTPDSIVVDKMAGTVVAQQLGHKGGDRADELCLSSQRIDALLGVVKQIEALFDEPVDVEWAFEHQSSAPVLLQARPVTAWVPLHESLVTAPGEPRRLYVDGYLTDAVTMSTAITPMSEDVGSLMYCPMLAWMFGADHVGEEDAGRFGLHLLKGRMYMDVSMYLHLLANPRMAALADLKNPIVGTLLTSPEIKRYSLAKPPPHARMLPIIGSTLALCWRMRGVLFGLLAPALRRQRFKAAYESAIAAFNAWIARPIDDAETVRDCIAESTRRVGAAIAESSLPAFVHCLRAQERIRGLADPKSAEQTSWANTVAGNYQDDMVVQMGAMLYDMARLLPAAEFEDIEALEERLLDQRLPAAFLAKWDEFVQQYGCRGPLEMELANPKYGDAPRLALRQMASILAAGEAGSPPALLARQAHRRSEAYDHLLAALPPRKAARLRNYQRASLQYGAARELFKHHIMQIYARVRALLTRHAEEFVRAERLDRPEQIFEMTVADVELALEDPHFDLRARVAQRGAHYRRLKTVPHFPMFIDSRGRILRTPQVVKAGALVGTAVSPGTAQGPVKVLNDPFEKEVKPGDVLVAVTADPGWTPLFLSAAAVVLEHGGELQHGALVAREYGKPCVTGIQDITTHFRDGQVVEVDGAAGTVRVVEA